MSVDDTPLHGIHLAANQWWACHYPERPHENYTTLYDYRCRACNIAFDAAVNTSRLTEIHELDEQGELVGVWAAADYRAATTDS